MNLEEISCKEELLNHNEKVSAETSIGHSLSSSSVSTDDIFGDPDVFPRVGDEYQVKIPTLIAISELQQIQNSPTDNADGIAVDLCAGEGLTIPIMWLDHVADHLGHVQEEQLATGTGFDVVTCADATVYRRLGSKRGTTSDVPLDSLDSCHKLSQGATCKVETSEYQHDHGKKNPSFTKRECRESEGLGNSNTLVQLRKPFGYVPLPDSPVACWSNAESQSFLLGLYIFGKNLVQVQRFVDSKGMGDVLSFYYGEFFRSEARCRWVECRKMRNRRCILGPRIFTGWRQQEILSRLLPSRTKEVQDTLIEATKAFSEGSASLEELIFTLKAMVGTEALVQAVGIGKGKRDLTGVVLDPVRTNPVIPARPEIPIGKACSSLTSEEIIKFLTGDFRLSKAKANDLFWEAIWPRLLARGWHSEQPKDVSSFSFKNSLVFLVPGIKKFSRKKLSKGNHYFNSVSDVLNKVAADPKLIELEAEEPKESTRIGDCQWSAATVGTKAVENGPSDHQRPCYLRPRVPDCSTEHVKFTVVDTSLFQVGMPPKVRETRSLPAEATSKYCPLNRAGETNSDNSSEQSSSSDASSNSQGESHLIPSDDKKLKNKRKNAYVKGDHSITSDPLVTETNKTLSINGLDLEGQCCKLFMDKQPLKDTKYQFSRRVKSEEQNSSASASKRQRLASCKFVGISSHSYPVPRECDLKNEVEGHFQMESVGTSSATAAAEDHQVANNEISEAVPFQENHRPRTLIDLNQQPQDFDSEGPVDMEVSVSQDDLKPKFSSETKQHNDDTQELRKNDVVPEEQQSAANGRRQSTRNRPPTTKALEALACGFLSVKGKSTKTPRSGIPRPSRRARKNAEALLPVPDANPMINSVNATPIVRTEEYYCTPEHTGFFNDSHVRSDRKEPHELFGVL